MASVTSLWYYLNTRNSMSQELKGIRCVSHVAWPSNMSEPKRAFINIHLSLLPALGSAAFCQERSPRLGSKPGSNAVVRDYVNLFSSAALRFRVKINVSAEIFSPQLRSSDLFIDLLTLIFV